MPPTTTVTFADLAAQYDDELNELRDAYEEAVNHLRSEYGDPAEWPPEQRQFVQLINETAKGDQQRQHALETFADRYEGNEFRVRPITGQESMDIELEIRQEAKSKDLDPEKIRFVRKLKVVDVATESAPEGVEGDNPSNCEEAIAMSLYDYIESLNEAGDTDFTAPGFGDALPASSDLSGDQPPAEPQSDIGDNTDADVRPSGDS